eukprot:gene608-1172_t
MSSMRDSINLDALLEDLEAVVESVDNDSVSMARKYTIPHRPSSSKQTIETNPKMKIAVYSKTNSRETFPTVTSDEPVIVKINDEDKKHSNSHSGGKSTSITSYTDTAPVELFSDDDNDDEENSFDNIERLLNMTNSSPIKTKKNSPKKTTTMANSNAGDAVTSFDNVPSSTSKKNENTSYNNSNYSSSSLSFQNNRGQQSRFKDNSDVIPDYSYQSQTQDYFNNDHDEDDLDYIEELDDSNPSTISNSNSNTSTTNNSTTTNSNKNVNVNVNVPSTRSTWQSQQQQQQQEQQPQQQSQQFRKSSSSLSLDYDDNNSSSGYNCGVSSTRSSMEGSEHETNRDRDRGIGTECARPFQLFQNCAVSTGGSSQKRCVRVVLGGSSLSRGHRSSGFSKSVCNSLRCLKCNFQ